MSEVILKDINGQQHVYDTVELYQQLADKAFTIFGIPITGILRFRYWYQMKCGPEPMTDATIDTVIGGKCE